MAALAYAYESSFADRVSDLLSSLDCRLVDVDADRETIYRLRYEAYMREDGIEPNSAETFCDDFDESENAWIFGLYWRDELASSIRIHVATQEQPDFPSRKVFADLMEPELAAGKVIVDPTRFVTDKRLSGLFSGLPHVTLRLCWLAAEHFEAEHFLVAVRREHQAFYRRTFHHRVICPPRPYPLLKTPISLMTTDQAAVAERVYGRYPFFRSTYFERRMLFDRHGTMAQLAARHAEEVALVSDEASYAGAS